MKTAYYSPMIGEKEKGTGRDRNAPLGDWQPPPHPAGIFGDGGAVLCGRHARLERLDPGVHAEGLDAAYRAEGGEAGWAYLPYGPFADCAAFTAWLHEAASGEDPLFFAIREAASGRLVGMASYLRIEPAAGSIEVGHIHFSPLMRARTIATETMFLMMGWAFDSGYRRYEWKCNALNAASRRAAMRLGFSWEGVFRQCTHSKGRNRDTAWFAIISPEWPEIKKCYERFLADDNFDSAGGQKESLSAMTAPLLFKRDAELG